jgi:hypothetical protein
MSVKQPWWTEASEVEKRKKWNFNSAMLADQDESTPIRVALKCWFQVWLALKEYYFGANLEG